MGSGIKGGYFNEVIGSVLIILPYQPMQKSIPGPHWKTEFEHHTAGNWGEMVVGKQGKVV